MSKTRHVYVTYIAVPAEKVWRALLDGEATRQYWGHFNDSDWKAGSDWRHRRADSSDGAESRACKEEAIESRASSTSRSAGSLCSATIASEFLTGFTGLDRIYMLILRAPCWHGFRATVNAKVILVWRS